MLFGTVLLAVVILPGLAPVAAHAAELPPGGTFVDDDQSIHEGSIEAIAAEEITAGCGGDRFCPDDAVTRGQMAAFLARALGLPAADVAFDDTRGHMFERAIGALSAAGITAGCNSEGTSFCPDSRVTRGQMAAFLARALSLPPADVAFDDTRGHMFERAVGSLAAAGITAGCNSDGTRYCPDDAVTRAQMATFLTRALGLTAIDPPDRDPAATGVLDSIQLWFPDQYDKAVRVARCESSLNPEAVNWAGGWHGLFQIAERYHRSSFERVTGQSWDDGIYVAYYNAQFASYLYDQSDSWSAWGCRGA